MEGRKNGSKSMVVFSRRFIHKKLPFKHFQKIFGNYHCKHKSLNYLNPLKYRGFLHKY